MSPTFDELIAESDNNIDYLEKERQKALDTYSGLSKPAEPSWGQLLGNLVGSILPIGVGYAFAGMSGAEQGAKSSAANYSLGLERLQKEHDADKVIAASKYKDTGEDLQKAKAEKFQLELAAAKDDSVDERVDKRLEHMGVDAKGLDRMLPPGVGEKADRTAGRPEGTTRTYRDLSTFGQQDKRENPPVEYNKQWQKATEARDSIADFIDRFEKKTNVRAADALSRKIGADIQTGLKNEGWLYNGVPITDPAKKLEIVDSAIDRNLQALDPNSAEAQMFIEAKGLSRSIARGIEAGVLTDQDVYDYQAIYMPRPLEASTTFFDRLRRFETKIQHKIDLLDQNFGRSYNVQGSRVSQDDGGANPLAGASTEQLLDALKQARMKRAG